MVVVTQGCCVSMESEVPEIILPDPTPETANNFYCKKVGLFSRDFEVYRDPERDVNKWLVIDTEGGLFDDNAYICGECVQVLVCVNMWEGRMKMLACGLRVLASQYGLRCMQSRTTSAHLKARLATGSVCAMPRWTS